MKLPPHIEAIRDKWLGTDYDGEGKPFLGVVNADISVLLVEIDRLNDELAKARGERNGKAAGRAEGSGF